jgi:hypothetical protein
MTREFTRQWPTRGSSGRNGPAPHRGAQLVPPATVVDHQRDAPRHTGRRFGVRVHADADPVVPTNHDRNAVRAVGADVGDRRPRRAGEEVVDIGERHTLRHPRPGLVGRHLSIVRRREGRRSTGIIGTP